ncbi:hypothetical protein DUI87_25637 [Hirundo rustica rustica]|uniref:Uncharacterized protein n=1 Tax=Hirundo rustica rustica TaxID=333673 RepID=A0A3M0JAF5_HIRRU|nr:hypothetical protein DUI87_25637 [Hirundo rustica rustica]
MRLASLLATPGRHSRPAQERRGKSELRRRDFEVKSGTARQEGAAAAGLRGQEWNGEARVSGGGGFQLRSGRASRRTARQERAAAAGLRGQEWNGEARRSGGGGTSRSRVERRGKKERRRRDFEVKSGTARQEGAAAAGLRGQEWNGEARVAAASSCGVEGRAEERRGKSELRRRDFVVKSGTARQEGAAAAGLRGQEWNGEARRSGGGGTSRSRVERRGKKERRRRRDFEVKSGTARQDRRTARQEQAGAAGLRAQEWNGEARGSGGGTSSSRVERRGKRERRDFELKSGTARQEGERRDFEVKSGTARQEAEGAASSCGVEGRAVEQRGKSKLERRDFELKSGTARQEGAAGLRAQEWNGEARGSGGTSSSRVERRGKRERRDFELKSGTARQEGAASSCGVEGRAVEQRGKSKLERRDFELKSGTARQEGAAGLRAQEWNGEARGSGGTSSSRVERRGKRERRDFELKSGTARQEGAASSCGVEGRAVEQRGKSKLERRDFELKSGTARQEGAAGLRAQEWNGEARGSGGTSSSRVERRGKRERRDFELKSGTARQEGAASSCGVEGRAVEQRGKSKLERRDFELKSGTARQEGAAGLRAQEWNGEARTGGKRERRDFELKSGTARQEGAASSCGVEGRAVEQRGKSKLERRDFELKSGTARQEGASGGTSSSRVERRGKKERLPAAEWKGEAQELLGPECVVVHWQKPRDDEARRDGGFEMKTGTARRGPA